MFGCVQGAGGADDACVGERGEAVADEVGKGANVVVYETKAVCKSERTVQWHWRRNQRRD
jgi:hypothetical protein